MPESATDERVVYKICSRAAWLEALRSGALAPSADDLRDGFIHLSGKDQVRGTLSRHFADQPDLVLLYVPVENLPDGALRWERSRGGRDFPHLYAPIPAAAISRVAAISPGDAGLPEGF